MEYKQLYQRLIDRILHGDGESTQQDRQKAFENAGLPQPLSTLIDKVAYKAYQVTDNDISSVKAMGINEDELFELIICGAVGEASRQYQSGLAALTEVIQSGGDHAA